MFHLAFKIVLSGRNGLKVPIHTIPRHRIHIAFFKSSGLLPKLIMKGSCQTIVLVNILKKVNCTLLTKMLHYQNTCSNNPLKLFGSFTIYHNVNIQNSSLECNFINNTFLS